MKIGILQTGHVAPALVGTFGEYGDIFARYLAGRGFDFAVYDVAGSIPNDLNFNVSWSIDETFDKDRSISKGDSLVLKLFTLVCSNDFVDIINDTLHAIENLFRFQSLL